MKSIFFNFTKMANSKEYIILHHSAVSRNKNDKQYDAISNYHSNTLGWGEIGYHYLIEPDGDIRKGRDINKSGAHTSQNLMNYRSVGVCLTGNFDIEEPTKEQKEALIKLFTRLQAEYGIPDEKIKLHRDFAKYKSCPGTRIPNDIKGYLNLNDGYPEWAARHAHELDKLNIMSMERPNDPMTRAEVATVLNRTIEHIKKITS